MSTPQEEGRAFEKRFAATWGARPTPASGATPRYKLDVGALELLWSLKWTSKKSYRLTEDDVLEMIDGASGPGSRGVIGMMGLCLDGIGEDLTVVRTEDLLAILRGDVEVVVPPSKLGTRRAVAEPSLLRIDT